MPTRTRTRNTGVHQGGVYRYAGGQTNQASLAPTQFEYCEDVADNPGIDHPFYKRKLKYGYVVCNGSNGSGWSYVGLEGWRGYSNLPTGLTLPTINATTQATRLRAMTNPGRPTMNPLLTGWELGDLSRMTDVPSMLKRAGRNLIREGASQYLAYEFGWRQLYNDIRAIVNINQSITRRVAELENLRSRGGSKRRMNLAQDVVQQVLQNQTLNSTGTLVLGSIIRNSQRKVWGTCRWIPSNWGRRPNPNSLDEKRLEAFTLITGTHYGNITSSAWDALPWSWLTDWVINIGDFVQANNNAVATSIGPVNIMSHTEHKEAYVVTSKPQWLTVSTVAGLRETKERVLASSSLTVNLPIMSGRQLSILGALGITRMRGVV